MITQIVGTNFENDEEKREFEEIVKKIEIIEK